MTELPEGERLSYEEPPTLGDRVRELEDHIILIWQLFDLHAKTVNGTAYRVDMLEGYTVAELLENRKQMDTWADGVHKNMQALRQETNKGDSVSFRKPSVTI